MGKGVKLVIIIYQTYSLVTLRVIIIKNSKYNQYKTYKDLRINIVNSIQSCLNSIIHI